MSNAWLDDDSDMALTLCCLDEIGLREIDPNTPQGREIMEAMVALLCEIDESLESMIDDLEDDLLI